MSRLILALLAMALASCASATAEPLGGRDTITVDSAFPAEYIEALVEAQAEWATCLDEPWAVSFVVVDRSESPDIVSHWHPTRPREHRLATVDWDGPRMYLPADQQPHEVRTVALHELGHFWGIEGHSDSGLMAPNIGLAKAYVTDDDCRALRYWLMGEGDDPVTEPDE